MREKERRRKGENDTLRARRVNNVIDTKRVKKRSDKDVKKMIMTRIEVKE